MEEEEEPRELQAETVDKRVRQRDVYNLVIRPYFKVLASVVINRSRQCAYFGHLIASLDHMAEMQKRDEGMASFNPADKIYSFRVRNGVSATFAPTALVVEHVIAMLLPWAVRAMIIALNKLAQTPDISPSDRCTVLSAICHYRTRPESHTDSEQDPEQVSDCIATWLRTCLALRGSEIYDLDVQRASNPRRARRAVERIVESAVKDYKDLTGYEVKIGTDDFNRLKSTRPGMLNDEDAYSPVSVFTTRAYAFDTIGACPTGYPISLTSTGFDMVNGVCDPFSIITKTGGKNQYERLVYLFSHRLWMRLYANLAMRRGMLGARPGDDCVQRMILHSKYMELAEFRKDPALHEITELEAEAEGLYRRPWEEVREEE